MSDVDGQQTDQPQEAEQVAPETAEQPVNEEQEEIAEPQVQEPSQQAEVNEGAEAPEDVEEAPEDDDFDPLSTYPAMGAQEQIPVGEDGTVDPYAFREQLKNEMRQEMQFERQEQQRWSKIEKKYPGISNEDRDLILNQRIAAAVQGKNGDIIKIADNLMGRLGTAKSQGRADAVTSRKVQKAAGLETATANSGGKQNENVLDKIAAGDKNAANNLMEQWLSEGKV